MCQRGIQGLKTSYPWLQENEMLCFKAREDLKEKVKTLSVPLWALKHCLLWCACEYQPGDAVVTGWFSHWAACCYSDFLIVPPLDQGLAVCCLSLMFHLLRSLICSVWWIRRLVDACCNAPKHRGQHCGEQRDSRGHWHGSCSPRHPTPHQNHRRGPRLLTGQPDWGWATDDLHWNAAIPA